MFSCLQEREGQREKEEIPVNPIQDNQDPQEYQVRAEVFAQTWNVKQYAIITKA